MTNMIFSSSILE